MTGSQRVSMTIAGLAALGLLAGGAVGQGSSGTGKAQKPVANNPVGVSDPNWTTSVVGRPNGGGQVVTTQQGEIIKKVTSYFNALTTLEGRFVQLDSDKSQSRGKFYLLRPGKFRFEYGGGSKKVIVSDGTYLAIQDLDLGNDDTFELDRTPFRLLLRKDVDLVRDASVLDVAETTDRGNFEAKR